MRRTGGLVMIGGIVLLALNLRPVVNSLGVVLPDLQQSTGISSTLAGLLGSLPTFCFAFIGFIAPAISARIGPHRAVAYSLIALTAGQVLRAAVPGTAAIFIGSIIALAGIAIANVLLPGLVRLHFPTAIPAMTAIYTTVLMLGQTLGAGITLPIQHGLHGTWRLGIGMWAVTAAVALVPWVVAVARYPRPGTAPERQQTAPEQQQAAPDRRQAPQQPSRIGVLQLFRSFHAWAMAVFFGVQSIQAYVVFAWLTSVLIDAGLSDETAAGMLAILTAVGIPISAFVPALLGVLRHQATLVIGFTSCFVIGYSWLLIAPTTAPWIPALLIGIGLGAFPMLLTLFALRARTPAGTTALSGFSQSIGYLIAATGPVGFGFLHDVTGDWTVPIVALLISLVLFLASGLISVRDWKIEDGLRSADRSTEAAN